MKKALLIRPIHGFRFLKILNVIPSNDCFILNEDINKKVKRIFKKHHILTF